LSYAAETATRMTIPTTKTPSNKNCTITPPRVLPAPNIILPVNTINNTGPFMMNLRSSGNKDKDLTCKLDKIWQMNKRNHQLQRQREEEEAKRQQDKEAGTPPGDNPVDSAPSAEDAISNFVSKVHNIMNGVQNMETSNMEKAVNVDICSPVKKRQGSSKMSLQRNAGTQQVSPPKVAAPTARSTTFLESFNHLHSRVILELAVVLKSGKAFEEFTQALVAFLSNAQMVDPKFVINPLNPNSKERNIASKGKISSNLTKLGAHVKISGNGNVFNKQKVWNQEEPDNWSTRKANKKEEFRDPTVYFTMIVSLETPPTDIIERMTHEWARLNGVRLQVKELQFVESETVVTFNKVSKLTPKGVLLAEFRKILLRAQAWAREDDLEEEL
jgi:hypothetical protein